MDFEPISMASRVCMVYQELTLTWRQGLQAPEAAMADKDWYHMWPNNDCQSHERIYLSRANSLRQVLMYIAVP
jgi:hypothetical protein